MRPVSRNRLKAFFSIFARYLIGGLLVYWLVRTEALDMSSITTISGMLIFQGIVLGISITAISTYRIRYLLLDQGIFVSYRRCFAYNSIGLFYSLFLPGGISGDAARAFFFFKDAPQKRIAVLGALLLDRFVGLITLVALGIMSGVFLASVISDVVPYLIGSSAILAALVIVLVLSVRQQIKEPNALRINQVFTLKEKIRSVVARLRLSDYSTRTLVVSMALSVLMNVLVIILIYLCSVVNESGLGFIEISAVAPLGLLANAIPLSPGGLGVGEKGFDLLYRAVGGDHGAGSFFTTRLFLYCPALLGGLFAGFFLLRMKQVLPTNGKNS